MNCLPKIAMGAWGNDGKSGNHYTAADLKDVYAAAMKNGLNLWDTAVVYGMGTSENILGELAKDTLPIIGVTKVHHVEDAAKAALVTLTAEEILLLEKAADECGISTIRYWEKKME